MVINGVSSFSKISRTCRPEERQQFVNEALFLTRVKHSNIVSLIDCGLLDSGKSFIKLPKLKRYSEISTEIKTSPKFRGNLIASVLSVLDFLSFINLCHGDLKPEHFMFDENEKCVVIDFAQVYSISSNSLIGTSSYFAPELFWKYPHSLQSDLFSFGIAATQMFYNKHSFVGHFQKYGSTLKPWAEEDVDFVIRELQNIDPISKIIAEFLTFSPISRPMCGRDVVSKMISSDLTTWRIDEYDKIIADSINHYAEMVHWYSPKSMLTERFVKEKLTLRPCHINCQHAFLNNVNVFLKFLGKNIEDECELNWTGNGFAICKQKYNIGFFPRRFPLSESLPSTIDASQLENPITDSPKISCDFRFHLPYFMFREFPEFTCSGFVNSEQVLDEIELLTEQRNFEKATSLIDVTLINQSHTGNNRIKLISLHAYCICHTRGTSEARRILNQISIDDLNGSLPQVLSFFYITAGWISLSNGELVNASQSFISALKNLRQAGGIPSKVLAKLYLRISVLKWLYKDARSAIYFCDKAIRISNKINCNIELKISILLNKSLLLGESGDFKVEKRIHKEIKKLLDNVKYSPLIINCLHNHGVFCLRTGQLYVGSEILKKTYVLAIQNPESQREIPHYLLSLGNALFSVGRVSNAIKAWKDAEEQFKNESNKYGEAKCQQNLAELSYLVGNKSEADEYSLKALRTYNQIGHKIGQIDIELLSIWHEVNTEISRPRIERVLKKSKKANYKWGVFQALNIKAVSEATNQNWSGLSDLLEELRSLTLTSPNSFLANDLHFYSKLCKLLKRIPDKALVSNLNDISVLVKGNWQLSYRLRRSQLTYLDYALENISRLKDVLFKISREVDAEGSILMAENKKNKSFNQKTSSTPQYKNHLKTLREISQVVDRNNDVETYVQMVLDKTVEVLQASRAAIFLTSKYSEEIEILGASGCQKNDVTDIKNVSRSLVHQALSGESIFIRDVSRQDEFVNIQSLASKKIKSAICIPLRKEDEVIGIIYVDSIHLATQFEDFDKDFLDTLGSIISGGVFTSKRLQKLNDDYMFSLSRIGSDGLRSSEGVLLPSPQMQQIYKTIFRISKTQMPVLLLGQSGSGKEILAKMIHENSPASNGRFVAINCSAIPEQNFESELFGVSKSTFTGVSEKPGKFEIAEGGTLFLDEIAELPINMQAKLLRVIETKKIERLGSNESKTLSFRLVCATNRKLQQMVSSGSFREDLYHRINDIKIDIPKLCERPEDIKYLVEQFRKQFQSQLNLKCPKIIGTVLKALLQYDWPGGIRELSKVIARLVVMSNGTSISLTELPLEIQQSSRHLLRGVPLAEKEIDKTLTKDFIRSQLRKNKFSIRKTARQLSIPESTLRYHIQKHKIQITPIRLRA